MINHRTSERRFTYFLLGMVAVGFTGLLVKWTSAEAINAPARSASATIDRPTGFAARINFSDAGQLLRLSDGGRVLVHGMTGDAEKVASARDAIRQENLEGIVSVERGNLTGLPYTENLVNLLLVDDFPALSDLSLDELLRVLAPRGSLWLGLGDDAAARQRLEAEAAERKLGEIEWIEKEGLWAKIVKPRPEEMGVWSHHRYDPSGTAVSDERELDVPNGVRWVAGPNWATHLRYSAVQGVTASQEKLVYFYDEEVPEDRVDEVETDLELTPTGRKRQHSLVARDAFNGLLLWKRWVTGRPSASQLVTLDDRIYVQLDERGPLLGLDPTTGETVMTYEAIQRPREVIHIDGRLVAVTRSDGIVCVDPQNGKVLWEYEEGGSSIVVGDGQVYFTESKRNDDGERETFLTSLDLKSGRRNWQSGTADWAGSSSLPLIFYRDGVLVFGGRATHAASAEDGGHLWTYQYPRIGHGGSYSKVLHFDGLVWVHPAESDGKKQYAWEGLDPRTGKVEKRFLQPKDFKMTHRCFSDRASGNQILCGTMDFVDIESGEYEHFAAARHSCRDGGVLPSNGMLYTFPHSCHCYPMLRGFLGLATKQEREPETPVIEQGPAFGKIDGDSVAVASDDWPTLRGNARRSASTLGQGPAALGTLWDRDIAGSAQGPTVHEWKHKEAGRLSSPVVAGGTLFVSVADAHRLDALDASTGKVRWSFTADGRIDAPPTIHDGLCLFGARDGRVYCLRADDGELVWRLRAAPQEERILAYGQLESTWPVVGGVLVHEGTAYFAAGRHSHGDGGIHVYAADPATGEIQWRAQPEGFMGLADMLVGSGEMVHMSNWQFDAQTGANRSSSSESDYLRAGRLGLVSDAWYERPIALRKNRQRWSLAGEAAQNFVFNDDRLVGFQAGEDQTREFSRGIGPLEGPASIFGRQIDGRRGRYDWTLTFPQGSQVRAMALVGDRMYFTGRLDGYDSDGYTVQAVSVQDGTVADSTPLKGVPVHDGLAVAGGRVYLSLQDGRIVCLGEAP